MARRPFPARAALAKTKETARAHTARPVEKDWKSTHVSELLHLPPLGIGVEVGGAAAEFLRRRDRSPEPVVGEGDRLTVLGRLRGPSVLLKVRRLQERLRLCLSRGCGCGMRRRSEMGWHHRGCGRRGRTCEPQQPGWRKTADHPRRVAAAAREFVAATSGKRTSTYDFLPFRPNGPMTTGVDAKTARITLRYSMDSVDLEGPDELLLTRCAIIRRWKSLNTRGSNNGQSDSNLFLIVIGFV